MTGEREADEQRADEQPSDGQRASGERSDGQQADGERSDGQQADGERSDGQQADEEPRDGPRTGTPTGSRTTGARLLTPVLRKPLLRGRFVRAALCGMLLAEAVAVLPGQIRWADGLGSTTAIADYPGAPAALRLITVSPTLLYSERTGLDAAVHETLWAVLFLGLLLRTARAVARRTAHPSVRSLPFCLALITFAPLAHLLALILLRLPRLAFEPHRRAGDMLEVLIDAQKASAHVMFLAAVGSCAAIIAALAAVRPDAPAAQGTGQQLRQILGPGHTVWRRIGVTLLLTCCALPLPKLLGSGFGEALYELSARALCAGVPEAGGGDGIAACADSLALQMTGSLPENAGGRISPVLFGYATVYALLGFACCFAALTLAFRVLPGMGRGPAATFLTTCAAYATGAVAYGALLDQALLLGAGEPSDIGQLLVPPSALAHTLLAAPLVGALFALGSWANGRRGKGRSGTNRSTSRSTNRSSGNA
ncbi:hypothetical protein [Streptomyces sp. NPDC048639]|uniref:hypothetical protein n=1 Tax=Streptomyces sp. NPDC048639 TaxID=3365581 RepID=UPI00371367F2